MQMAVAGGPPHAAVRPGVESHAMINQTRHPRPSLARLLASIAFKTLRLGWLYCVLGAKLALLHILLLASGPESR
jgi:hypothetical protein